MHHSDQKGPEVTPTEHRAQKPSPATGLLATVPSGASATLKVKLSAAAVKALKGGKALKAALTGTGIETRSVKLKAGR